MNLQERACSGEAASSTSSPSAFASFASTKGASGFAGLSAGAGNAANGLTFGGGGVGAVGNGSAPGRLGARVHVSLVPVRYFFGGAVCLAARDGTGAALG